MLVGAADRDLSVRFCGLELPTPLLMAPIGVIGLCSQDGHGDLATARAAAATGVPMVTSTLSVDPLEDIAAQFGDTPGLFQLYTPNDRELAESFVRRAEAAGFAGLVVTLDTWTLGWRPRDLSIASFPQLAGLCLANYFTDPVFRDQLSAAPEDDVRAAAMHWVGLFGNPTLTWDDLAWLRSLTSLPLILKGICHPEDARRAIDGGVDAIYCSTHGGRQANGGIGALDMLPAVVDAAGDVPVLFDSGVRSGDHIVKALALGATAVGIGRPYAWGLALGGSRRHRPRVALPAGRGRPADGRRRVPDDRPARPPGASQARLSRSARAHRASWKMTPSAVRRPAVTVETPWRMPTR